MSHASEDNEICARYASRLREVGVDVWFDGDNMQLGLVLTDQIDQQLRKRPAFLNDDSEITR